MGTALMTLAFLGRPLSLYVPTNARSMRLAAIQRIQQRGSAVDLIRAFLHSLFVPPFMEHKGRPVSAWIVFIAELIGFFTGSYGGLQFAYELFPGRPSSTVVWQSTALVVGWGILWAFLYFAMAIASYYGLKATNHLNSQNYLNHRDLQSWIVIMRPPFQGHQGSIANGQACAKTHMGYEGE
jgi:hypothetical protein